MTAIKREDVLFSAENSLQKGRNYFFYAIGALIVLYCCFKFTVSPIIMSFLIVFILLMFLVSGYNKVVVYQNSIEFIVKHPINKLSKCWNFSYENILSIDANLQLSKKAFILLEILNSYIPGGQIWNTIVIHLKNGNEKTINTKVYKKDLIEAFGHVEKNTKDKIKITGYK
jgi:hypothetical protein